MLGLGERRAECMYILYMFAHALLYVVYIGARIRGEDDDARCSSTHFHGLAAISAECY